MASTYKILKKDIKVSVFINQLKYVLIRAFQEHKTKTINTNQYLKITHLASQKIQKISDKIAENKGADI